MYARGKTASPRREPSTMWLLWLKDISRASLIEEATGTNASRMPDCTSDALKSLVIETVALAASMSLSAAVWAVTISRASQVIRTGVLIAPFSNKASHSSLTIARDPHPRLPLDSVKGSRYALVVPSSSRRVNWLLPNGILTIRKSSSG